MNVYKFGGSSLSDAKKIIQIKKEIIDIDECAIVLSAIGKKNDNDVKLTDLLIELCKNKTSNDIKNTIKRKILTIAKELKVSSEIEKEVNAFLSDIEKYTDEYIISRGEYFTCKIFSAFSGVDFIDSAKFIIFEENRFSYEKTRKKVLTLRKRKFITCGFYGSNEKGDIILFPRGGGDTTGAILASILNSKYYFNCTDVDGIYSVPPNYSDEKNTIKKLSYAQLYILSVNGLNTFSKEAILYLINKSITLKIMNAINFDAPYTEVTDDNSSKDFYNVLVINNIKYISFLKSEKRQDFSILYRFLENIMSDKIQIEDFSIFNDQYKIAVKNIEETEYRPYDTTPIQVIKKITWIESDRKIECIYLPESANKKEIKRVIKTFVKKQ